MVTKNPTKTITPNITPKQRWKKAVDKFKIALIPETYKPGSLAEELVDSVRVGIVKTIKESETQPYLEEIATHKHTFYTTTQHHIHKREFQMLSMSNDQLKTCQLLYDKESGILTDYKGNNASTIGKVSKGTLDLQAFVMSKRGELYCSTHTGKYDPNNLTLTHASFLQGRPAELAGMISIKDGQITFISANSGHYAPEPLDMYRGIKKLDKLMPDVITPDCKIEYYDDKGGHINYVNQFIKMMETPDAHGKLLHEKLRENRINKLQQYQHDLKNSVSLVFETNINNIPKLFAKIPPEAQKNIAEHLQNKSLISFTIKNESIKKPITLTTSDIIDQVISCTQNDAMKSLLDSGFASRPEFYARLPLSYTEHNENLVILLNHKSIQPRNFYKGDIEYIMSKTVHDNNVELLQLLTDKLGNEIPRSLIKDLKSKSQNKEIIQCLDDVLLGEKSKSTPVLVPRGRDNGAREVDYNYDVPKDNKAGRPVPAPRGRDNGAKEVDYNYDVPKDNKASRPVPTPRGRDNVAKEVDYNYDVPKDNKAGRPVPTPRGRDNGAREVDYNYDVPKDNKAGRPVPAPRGRDNGAKEVDYNYDVPKDNKASRPVPTPRGKDSEIANKIYDQKRGDIDNNELLCKAAENNDMKMIKNILTKHSPDIFKDYMEMALSAAVLKGHKDVVEYMIQEVGNDIPPKALGRFLRTAAEEEHREILTLVIDNFSGKIDDKSKGLALQHSAAKGKNFSVEKILDNMGDNIGDKDKSLALYFALNGNHQLTAKTILDRSGIDVKIGALNEASKYGKKSIIKLLNHYNSHKQDPGDDLTHNKHKCYSL